MPVLEPGERLGEGEAVRNLERLRVLGEVVNGEDERLQVILGGGGRDVRGGGHGVSLLENVVGSRPKGRQSFFMYIMRCIYCQE